MAFITADRVKETTTTTGTGTITLAGAASGFRAFSSVMATNDTCYYSIVSQTGTSWEVGLGTLASSTTLARTTVLASSNSNALVSLSGTHDVFITFPAKQAQGALTWQSVQTANFAAVAGNAYPVNTTSGAITVTLPASPSAGNIVQITDYAGTWATNNVTVAPNGSKIAGDTANAVFGLSRESLAFVYIDATQGWIPYSGLTKNPLPYTASYLIVGGGGAGGGVTSGSYVGAGGGAGGYLTGSISFTLGSIYTVIVGAGGTGVGNNIGGSGSNSSITGITAAVGGGGGGGGNTPTGGGGGSGGGGAGGGSVSQTAGSGTSGQGNTGGGGQVGSPYRAGGGGGANAAGATGSASGNGGSGSASSITGVSITYAGGGGGGSGISGTFGMGGAGGGGNGIGSGNGNAATTNTGGGGGGAGNYSAGTYVGGNGGSGVVILSIPTLNYTGVTTGSPTVTTNGSNTVLTFTSSGSYTA